jgi:hypothetical protein
MSQPLSRLQFINSLKWLFKDLINSVRIITNYSVSTSSLKRN